MADDTNEDSWLYGTSNPDSTTNEISNGSDALAAEHEALAAVTGEKPGTGALLPAFPKEEMPEYAEFEDPAKEMEEDEEALPDTTDGNAMRTSSGADAAGSGLDDGGSQDDDEEMAELKEGAGGTARKERNGSGSDDDDDDDSDDDINVVIGDIKSAPSTYNIKQRPNLLAGATADKAKPSGQAGKFSIEDFEGAGTINGVAVHEFSIDSLEEKPWRKPGADITDYFNYGFNEETWRAYCERQKRFRVAESGVGLASLTQNVNQSATSMMMPDGSSSGGGGGGGGGVLGSAHVIMGGPMGMSNPMHHHQQQPLMAMGDGPMQMPPPGMPPMMQHQPRPGMGMMARPPRPISTTGGVKENAIQVMTAECREYSRGGLGPMAPNFPPPGASDEPFFHEPEPFDYGYEPTQESQWSNDNAGWVPTGIKELTPGPAHHSSQQQPPQMGMPPQLNVPPPQMGGPPPQLRGQHAPPGMMPPNMRMPHNMGMGPPPGMMRMPHNMNMGPQQRMPMGSGNGNNSNMPPSSSSDRRSDSYDDDRERRRREKDKQLKKEQLRKDFLDMLRERHDIERHTRWYDIKKKFEADPRYRALDSAYREEYFEDYLHILKEEKRKEREHKERDRERSARDKRSRDKDKEKEKEKDKDKEKDKEKDKDKDKEKESSRREARSRSREKSSRRKSKSREKDRSERSSKQGSSSTSGSSSRSEKKKSHRKDKEEEE